MWECTLKSFEQSIQQEENVLKTGPAEQYEPKYIKACQQQLNRWAQEYKIAKYKKTIANANISLQMKATTIETEKLKATFFEDIDRDKNAGLVDKVE